MADEGLLVEGRVVGAQEVVADPVDAVVVQLAAVLDRRVEPVVQLRVAGEPDVLLGRDRIQERIVGQVVPIQFTWQVGIPHVVHLWNAG